MCIVSAAVTEVMKEMRNWGRSGMASCCFIVCCESSSWLWLKTGA